MRSRGRVSVTEEGAAATYDVRLGSRPQGNVVVQISTPSGLGFNATTWNTARVVTVQALTDANAGREGGIRHYMLDA